MPQRHESLEQARRQMSSSGYVGHHGHGCAELGRLLLATAGVGGFAAFAATVFIDFVHCLATDRVATRSVLASSLQRAADRVADMGFKEPAA